MAHRNILVFLAFLILLSPISVSSQVFYDFVGYTAVAHSANLDYPMTFNYTDTGTCQVKLQSFNTFTKLTGSFDSTVGYYSPRPTQIGSSLLEGLTNTSCLAWAPTTFKTTTKNSTTNLYETGIIYTQSADSGRVTTTTTYSCLVQAGDFLARFTVDRAGDSLSHCQYRARKTFGVGAKSHTAWLTTLESDYNSCADLTAWSYNHPNCVTDMAGAGGQDTTSQYIYPFNASGGSINYDFTAPEVVINTGLSISGDYWIDLINIDTGATTNILHVNQVEAVPGTIDRTFFPTATASGTLPLTEDELYLWVITWEMDTSAGWTLHTSEPPILTMEVYSYHGDFLCGPWSTCVNGSQFRTCEDQNGISPDRGETRSCILTTFFENIRGFEEFYENTTYTCQINALCQGYLTTMTTKYPLGWSVSNSFDLENGYSRDYFLDMSSDTATEGTKSLKMWFVPQKDEEPIPDNLPGAAIGNTSCGNLTVGKFPETNTPYNETHFVSINVSFPYPFMDIRFDVKRCSQVVQQHGPGWGGCFLFHPLPICYGDCNITPSGKYGARITDADTGELIFDFTPSEEAGLFWERKIIVLDNLIEEDKNYTFALAVNPTNVFDDRSHCVYFDNVTYTLRDGAVQCNSFCDTDTYDYFRASIDSNGVCTFSVEEFSPICVPANISQAVDEILSGEGTINATCIGNTLISFDTTTGKITTTPESPTCIALVEETTTEQEAMDPITGTESAIELFSFLWTPITLFFIFSLIISGILMGGVAKYGDSDPAWQVFGITMLIFTLIGTVFSIVPIWIAVTIVATISLLIANKLRTLAVGGG